jgi:hypothetical protein
MAVAAAAGAAETAAIDATAGNRQFVAECARSPYLHSAPPCAAAVSLQGRRPVVICSIPEIHPMLELQELSRSLVASMCVEPFAFTHQMQWDQDADEDDDEDDDDDEFLADDDDDMDDEDVDDDDE